MKQEETFKCYISYFHSQMAPVHNYNDDIVAAAFIVILQTDHFFYKYLMKHDVTSINDILS